MVVFINERLCREHRVSTGAVFTDVCRFVQGRVCLKPTVAHTRAHTHTLTVKVKQGDLCATGRSVRCSRNAGKES